MVAERARPSSDEKVLNRRRGFSGALQGIVSYAYCMKAAVYEINGKLQLRQVDNRRPRMWPNGKVTYTATTLADLRALVGGDVGTLRHPITRETLEVSLEQWSDSDPNTTYIEVSYISLSRPDPTRIIDERTAMERLWPESG